ncbi:MAG: polyprenyl synthetase family protein [Planctomycetota bacterium]
MVDNVDKKAMVVPREAEVRARLRAYVAEYAVCRELIPPLQEEEVLSHADAIVGEHPEAADYRNLLAVLINNQAWRGVVSSIPFERRILLLPKCFRNAEHCPAEVDELGLLCQNCGACELGNLVSEAESLGYQVLISEGTTTVAMLMASGQVEAVVGVACLSSFEKSFPLVSNEAVPAQAVPLLNDDCRDSVVDREWLSEVLRLRNSQVWYGQISIDDIKATVQGWFGRERLDALLLPGDDPTLGLACEWLSRGGKYWRPLIMTCLYRALSGNEVENERAQRLAVAVECFHKASLIHDDIEDEDDHRYDRPTLHNEHGVPVALNVGDLLIGLGYQLIAESGADAPTTARMLEVASQGHVQLCLGQGRELIWTPQAQLLSREETLEIYRKKTAPAFAVALKMGAALAGAREEMFEPLSRFSEALGVAYQIQDDLEALEAPSDSDLAGLRPSLPVALAGESDAPFVTACLERIGRGEGDAVEDLLSFMSAHGVCDQAREELEVHRCAAFAALRQIHSASAKSLLQRLLNKLISP